MALADTGCTRTILNEDTARLADLKVARLAKPKKIGLVHGYCFLKLMVPMLELYV